MNKKILLNIQKTSSGALSPLEGFNFNFLLFTVRNITYAVCLLLVFNSCSGDDSGMEAPPDIELAISGVSVNEGNAGEEVTIYGEGFSNVKSENTITFADIEVDTILNVSASEITTWIPEVSGPAKISVKVNGVTTTSDFMFNVVSLMEPSTPIEVQEHDFYTETIQQVDTTVNLVDDYGANGFDNQDDSANLQTAIDELTELPNGGEIYIPVGTFYFDRIRLKSNIHLVVDPEATLKPHLKQFSNNYTYVLFELGNDTMFPEYIHNVSIRSAGEENFKVDLRELFIDPNPKVRVVLIKNAQNFLVSGFDVKDDYSVFNAVALTAVIKNEEYRFSSNGVVKNLSIGIAHHGYGLVQIQLTQNVLFKNLHSEGGSTIRFESGWERLSRLNPEEGMDELYARSISNQNGFNAIFMSPHEENHGKIDIDGVYAHSSVSAVKIDSGFDQIEDNQRPPGTFDSGESNIRNVHAVYGENAQLLLWKDEKYVPCEIRDKIADQNNADERSVKGPSIVPVLYRAYGNEIGDYKVNISNVTSEGFRYQGQKIITEEDAEEECN